ncbi:gamma-secretase subunit Aph-1 [Cladochytrium replicatum]|nr:gamma-secretase subunit Aph-1 [Cladochytrium replicatum]
MLSMSFWQSQGATLPMAAIGVGVAFQELARYGFFVLYAKSEKGLSVISRVPNSPMNRPEHAFVAGFGFGLISGLTMYITQLAESWGPGVILCNSCPSVDVFFVSAMQTCVFIFLHIVWTMVMFDGFLTRQWWKPVYVVLTHYGASFSTLLVPSTIMGGCAISIAICAAILMVTTFIAVRPVFKIIKGV